MPAVGVPAVGVVAGQPFEDLSAAGGLVGPGGGVLEDLPFEGALNDWARDSSALDPMAPMDWVTPRAAQSVA